MRSAALLLLSPLLAAQTFIVDRAGGGQFTDLPQAIAAVPGGAVLRVRPGIYSAFALANKSLSILGDAPDTVQVDLATGDVAVGPLSATDKVVVHNLRCLVPLIGSVRVLVQNAGGQVILDHVSMTAASPPLFGTSPRVQILGSANVHLLDCAFPSALLPDTSGTPKCEVRGSWVELAGTRIEGEPGATSGFGSAPGNPALLAVGSTLFLHRSALIGGVGAPAVGCGLPGAGPTAGGSGCVLTAGSSLDLVGGTIQGGPGGNDIACRPGGGNGGAGARVDLSVLRTAGASPAGGAGGPSGGSAGPATVVGTGGSVVALAAPAVTATLRGTQGLGQVVQCSANARSGDFAILLFGYDQTIAVSPLLTVGALQLVPVLAFGAFLVPGTGVLDVPLPIPLTWPLDQWIPFQFLVVPPTFAEVWAGNAAAILVKS